MKKFEFSLRKLNDYKHQVLKSEQETLASFRQRQNELTQKKETLQSSYQSGKEKFQAEALSGTSSTMMIYNRSYVNALMEQIRFTEANIQSMEGIIDKQVGVVAEISKDIKIMEKLEEKQRSEYKAQEQKQFDLFIEEFVGNKSRV